MHLCPFCGARVPDLANHYGGHKVEPCPSVADAFGPEDEGHKGGPPVVIPPGAYARSDFAHECMEPGCTDPVYRAQRCWEHHQLKQKQYKRNARARVQPAAAANRGAL